ncbi:MAG TPA: hypothetical protein GXX20_07105 [Clostridiaceae bacterium]|nr:hypothetical protein [Clostridiaceae bacterium]
MEAIMFAFFAFTCFCISAIAMKDKPLISIIFGIFTSVCSGLSMYLLWQLLEESGRDTSYIGPWGHPIIPVVYVVFMLLGFMFVILGCVKLLRQKQ